MTGARPLQPPSHVLKSLGAQLALLVGEREMRMNLSALFKYLAFLFLVVLGFSLVFQVLMVRYEGQEHSFIAGLYWTLVTMSTLGYGDIAFETDVGRAYSLLVLVSGVVLLLVVLPFIFIRYFYAPWLEAQVRTRAPRSASPETAQHVIIADIDPIAPGLIEHLEAHDIPYLVLVDDAERAARLHGEGLSVMFGERDSRETYVRANAPDARLVVANMEDVENTNVILTVREVAPDTPIAAIASSEDAVDIMELAGATHVLPLRRQLGEQLANRINAGHAETHVIGRFRDLVIAEFAVLNTPLAGKTIREAQLRETLGLSIVAVWQQARLRPAAPDLHLSDQCIVVVIGTEEQMREMDELLYIYDTNWNPVLVIGGGKVGRAATRALRKRGVTVHLIERNRALAERWAEVPDRMLVGDAANRQLLEEAGIGDAPAVVLTTNDDAMNVFLAVYCRKLNPSLRIVSRITHDRNIESIQRAGADLVMSYSGLGTALLTSLARGRRLVSLGEGIELLEEPVPSDLEGKTLAQSEIGQRTGLNVIAIESAAGHLHATPRAQQELPSGGRLYMIGSVEQHQAFREAFPEKEGR